MNAAVSIMEPVNGGVVLVMAAQCHEDVVVLRHLDVRQIVHRKDSFSIRRVKGLLIPGRIWKGKPVRLAHASVVIIKSIQRALHQIPYSVIIISEASPVDVRRTQRRFCK